MYVWNQTQFSQIQKYRPGVIALVFGGRDGRWGRPLGRIDSLRGFLFGHLVWFSNNSGDMWCFSRLLGGMCKVRMFTAVRKMFCVCFFFLQKRTSMDHNRMSVIATSLHDHCLFAFPALRCWFLQLQDRTCGTFFFFFVFFFKVCSLQPHTPHPTHQDLSNIWGKLRGKGWHVPIWPMNTWNFHWSENMDVCAVWKFRQCGLHLIKYTN